MSDCQPEVRQWKGSNLYVCETHNIRTLDADAFRQRHDDTPPPLTSTTGLLGPDGDPLPAPADESEPDAHDEPGKEFARGVGEHRSHDDVYQTPHHDW